MVSAGTGFMFVLFYLVCLLAAKFSNRTSYKRMWNTAAIVLGVAIFFTAIVYIIEVAAMLLAL